MKLIFSFPLWASVFTYFVESRLQTLQGRMMIRPYGGGDVGAKNFSPFGGPIHRCGMRCVDTHALWGTVGIGASGAKIFTAPVPRLRGAHPNPPPKKEGAENRRP
jgi:hypothetical protein